VSVSSHDFAVIGGGIAGLAIAELFQRSGHDVVLLEKNQLLCQEASANQHGWFHFGSLYSIFPQNQFLRTLVGGVEDLLAFYSGFENMNIGTDHAGKLMFPETPKSWFRDEPIEYIVASRNDPDFALREFGGMKAYGQKLFFLATWELAIKQFISRHQRFRRHDWNGTTAASEWIPRAGFGDYSRSVITKPDLENVNLDRDTHFRITGYDRPMRSVAIARDLAASFIAAGGTLKTATEVEAIESAGGVHRLPLKQGGHVTAKRVIVASGQGVGRFLDGGADVKTVASPMLVAYPALTPSHFVRMTPFVDQTINHLHHDIEGKCYSLIGGGHSAPPGDAAACNRVTDELLAMARRVFPGLKDSHYSEPYLGYKTEIVPRSGERNYQYIMREMRDGVHAVVPGKFSLSFSLAVNLYKKINGRAPSAVPATSTSGAQLVGLTRHAQMVQKALAHPRPTQEVSAA
jgi:glycine/D-amino acid oxidase-like deaminating enzyme